MKINDFFKTRTLSQNQNVLNQTNGNGASSKLGSKNNTAASVANSESGTESVYNDNSSVEMNSNLNSDNSNENSLDQQQLHIKNAVAATALNAGNNNITDTILNQISLDGVRKRNRKGKAKNMSADFIAESIRNNLVTFSNCSKSNH
jgi:hypothetical protein